MAAPRFRFAAYDLESCVQMAKAVHAGGGVLTVDQLADRLGYKSSNNGAFNTRLANARLFGLVDGSSELRPSERALRIMFPDFKAAGTQARIDAFEAVPLFGAVLDEYHGKPLPDEMGLKNALRTRWGVNEDKVGLVYSRLLESAEQAGLFEEAGGRTKLLRPPNNGPVHTAASHGPVGAPAPARGEAIAPPTRSSGVASNRLVQAALDELPDAEGVNEEQLQQWLGFFESALRVVYRIPSGGPR